MTNYELLLVLKKELNFKKRIELIKNVIKFILNTGGIILNFQYLGLQSVYYSKKVINRDEKGKYTLLQISINPKFLKELEEIIKQNTSILRHIIVKTT